jgi:3-oxoadipate enol-lactonase
MPTTTDRASEIIKPQLVPGEELLWAGAPRADRWALLKIIVAALFLIALIYLLLSDLMSPDFQNTNGADRRPLLDVLVVCSSVASLVYTVARRRRSLFFGVTDRRAISVDPASGLKVQSAALPHVDSVEITDRYEGSGTVRFGARRIPKSVLDMEAATVDTPTTGPVVFYAIEDVDSVASLVISMLDKRHEEEWDAAVAGLSLRSAKSGEIKIAYAEAGSGKPIVFLHGVGATKKCWAMQMRLLSRRYRCIALDYRGYGDSDVPPIESISREAFANDVAAVMDAAGIEKAVLCGNSLGGVVALEFYKQFPQRVRSLIMVDSFAFYPGGAESIPDRIKTLDELGIEKFAETRSPALFAPNAPKWLVERARADLASIPLEVYKASTRVTWSGDYRELLPSIKVGALVVWGEHDTKIAPFALSKELMFGIPAASDLAVVPGAGHIPQMENPIAFNADVAGFLK